jgi:hypothetical protein
MKYRATLYSLLIITLLIPVFIYLQQKLPFMEALLHSDALYGSFLIEDVLKDFDNYRSWHVAPNPSLFPDFLGYLIAYLLTRDHYLSVPIYFFGQLCLLCTILYGLYRHFFNQELALATTLLIVSMLIGITLTASGPPYSLLLMSGYHIGNFIMLLAVLWLFFNLLDGNHTSRDTGLLIVILFLASVSDRLIIVNTVAPVALITTMLLALGQLQLPLAIRIYVVLAVGSAGMFFSKYTMPYEVNYASYGFAPSIYKIPYGLEILLDVLQQCFKSTPQWLSITLLVAGSIILCLAAFRLVSSISTPAVMREKPLLLCAFVLASIGCTFAAPVIHASVFPRYLLPFFLLPFVLAPVLIVTQTWMALAMTRTIVLILALGPGLANVYALQKGDRSLQMVYYPEDIACIDKALAEQEATFGIAQYWDARYIAAYARESSPQITHVYANLQPYRWMISETQFRDRYDFAIIHLQTYPIYTLNEQYLVELNGPPSYATQCGVRKLLVYKNNGLSTGN